MQNRQDEVVCSRPLGFRRVAGDCRRPFRASGGICPTSQGRLRDGGGVAAPRRRAIATQLAGISNRTRRLARARGQWPAWHFACSIDEWTASYFPLVFGGRV